MLYKDFDSLARTLNPDFFKSRVSQTVVENLNPNMGLRGYQKEALGRLDFYLNGYANKQTPVHLLFNMATGSGKTLVMAGAMVQLYKLGYRNVIFFVNSTNIIEKTRANFLDSASSKYQFAQNITIDSKKVVIRSVENFSATDPDGINVLFTTIQGLHTRMNEPRENVLTEEDFDGRDMVFLSDEAHHINAWTRSGRTLTGDEENAKTTWEGTINRILHKNTRNVMLEFTATIDTDNPDIARKYEDKLIYRYDLAQFRNDGFSKDIHVTGIDFEAMDRAIGAVVLSHFRRKVAEHNGIHLKPVVMMKSERIDASLEFEIAFHEKIKSLKASDIEKFKKRGSDEHKKVFIYLEKNGITVSDFVKEIKNDFGPEKCVSVNSKDDTEAKQLLINSLEDKTNPIRVVFAVDKLNEGWDVLNLFDIVRLYETRPSGHNRLSPKTIAEAQLIGRGARYWPFSLTKDTDDRYVRKFDTDLENELRILEELHYHSKYDNRYISEITTALVQTGAIAKPENVKEYRVVVKESFKKTRFWKDGQIFVNKKRETGRKHLKKLYDIPGIPERFVYDIHRGGGHDYVVFEKTGANVVRELTTKDIESFDPAIWRAALCRLPFYTFASLTKFFPNIESIADFITSNNWLAGVKIGIRGEHADVLGGLMRDESLEAALYVLREIESLVRANTSDFEGTQEFTPQPIYEVVKDKSLRIVVTEGGEQEFGVPMKSARDANLRLNLDQKDWYIYDENYGTSEEKRFVHDIHDAMSDLQKRYNEVYLLRNEGLIKLYRFADGRAIEPDFILFLRESHDKQALMYQLFVEPKGDQLRAVDAWKEEFLKTIDVKTKFVTLHTGDEYRIIGLPFFTAENNAEFETAFETYK